MKIALASDLHLEFGDILLKNTENADLLILSGDICVAADFGRPDNRNVLLKDSKSNRIIDFFKRCSFQFPHTIYIMGNHEHYHGDFAASYYTLKSMLESHMLSNVYLLDKETKVINDVTFIGGTLWTDMNKEDPLTLHSISGQMNDFQCVRNSDRKKSRRVPLYKKNEDGSYAKNEKGYMIEDGFKFKEEDSTFSPGDSVEDHRKFIAYIDSVIKNNYDKKYVVVGHHAPSTLSTNPIYSNQTMMNGAYRSDLSEFILDNPQIKLWTHGHTHHKFDYMIGDTRITCNPRGYIGYENSADVFELQYLEI